VSGIRCSPRIATASSSDDWARSSTGKYQKYAVESGAYVREHFGRRSALPTWSSTCPTITEEDDARGHDRSRSYNAYKAPSSTRRTDRRACPNHQGATAREAGEGKNINPPQKKMNEEELARVPHPLRDSDPTPKSARPRLPPREDSIEIKVTCAKAQGARRYVRRARSRRGDEAGGRGRLREFQKGTDAARRPPRWCSCGCCRSCCATEMGHLVCHRPDESAHLGMKRCSVRLASTARRPEYQPVDWTPSSIQGGVRTDRSSRKGFNEAVHPFIDIQSARFMSRGRGRRSRYLLSVAPDSVNTIPVIIRCLLYFSDVRASADGDLGDLALNLLAARGLAAFVRAASCQTRC